MYMYIPHKKEKTRASALRGGVIVNKLVLQPDYRLVVCSFLTGCPMYAKYKLGLIFSLR